MNPTYVKGQWMNGFNSPTNGNLRGALFMLLATAFFAIMDAVIKSLSMHYSPMQIATLRGFTALPLVLLYVSLRCAWHTVLKVRWVLHLVRGSLAVAMLSLFALGVQDMPMTTAYTLFFIAPLLISALSVPLLREHVPAAHWWAITVGFIGVMVALQGNVGISSAGTYAVGGLAIVAAALCYAFAALTARLVGRTDSSESMVLWLTVTMSFGAGVFAYFDWQPIREGDLPALFLLGVTGFCGQLSLTEAFRNGNASAVAPFEYSALAWGLCLDFFIWQSLPQWNTWLGAGIIIGSGLFLLQHERSLLISTTPDNNSFARHEAPPLRVSEPTLSRHEDHM